MKKTVAVLLLVVMVSGCLFSDNAKQDFCTNELSGKFYYEQGKSKCAIPDSNATFFYVEIQDINGVLYYMRLD